MTPAYDAIVLGLGGMGSAAAAHLARRGQRVLGIEQFGPAHDRGSSHGRSRMIRQAYFEDPAYVPLVLRAYELWAELEAASGRPLLTLTGGLTLGAPECAAVAGSLRTAQHWGLAHELLERADLRRRFPTFHAREGDVAVFEARAGMVSPEATVTAHLGLAAAAGADLRFEQGTARWRVDGPTGSVRVDVADRTFTAGVLVLAPGPWAPSVLPALSGALHAERRVQYWFEPIDPPARFLPDRHPVYLWEHEEGQVVYGFPADDAGLLKVGFHQEGGPCTPETLDRTVGPGEVAAARSVLARCLPGAAGPLVAAAPCLYTMSPDAHFVIGRHPGLEQVVVACGFSGHGFKFVPAVGEALADLATGRTPRTDLALFDPDRLAPGHQAHR